jgi:hypothetical protein
MPEVHQVTIQYFLQSLQPLAVAAVLALQLEHGPAEMVVLEAVAVGIILELAAQLLLLDKVMLVDVVIPMAQLIALAVAAVELVRQVLTQLQPLVELVELVVMELPIHIQVLQSLMQAVAAAVVKLALVALVVLEAVEMVVTS